MFCSYYHARLVREKIWFVAGTIRAENNLAFDRALDTDPLTFEFFVPSEKETEFLEFMDIMIRRGHVLSLEKKENRYKQLSAKIPE